MSRLQENKFRKCRRCKKVSDLNDMVMKVYGIGGSHYYCPEHVPRDKTYNKCYPENDKVPKRTKFDDGPIPI
jgi:hypothetical protein